MPVDYSLADLARLADVTPRTIRYYVAQGLLPSPDAAGPATRYSEWHLARLRLIRRLQRDHLPLAEIRERLERMSDDEVDAALAATGTVSRLSMAADADETVGYIRKLMEQAHIEPNVHPAPRRPVPPPSPSAGTPSPDMSRAVMDPLPAETAARRDVEPPDGPHFMSLAKAAVDLSPVDRPSQRTTRSTWERLVITPDIEIHVRRPLKPLDNKRADILERHARELFQDEP